MATAAPTSSPEPARPPHGGQGPLVSLFDDRMWAEIDCFFVDDTDTTQGIWVGGSPRQRR